jgi:hypothetical protein
VASPWPCQNVWTPRLHSRGAKGLDHHNNNGDDQSKLFIRWNNNYRNTGKTRINFAWVQEHKITGDSKIDGKQVTRGCLPAKVIMFFTVFEPKVMGKRREDRIRYQCAYVETLIVDNKNAVDPTHSMMTI